jgi:hypothetical protein
MLVSSVALADDPCGGFEALASGSCEYEVSGGCVADCTPLNFVAACDGQCNVEAGVDCTGGCQAQCEAECTPGSIDCEASCSSSCYAGCDTECTDAGCKTQCRASCDNRCKIGCDVNPPDCTASCKVACDATCRVKANIDCSVQCSADIEGGCKTQCDEPQGALFCDGQYVHASNLDACIDDLSARGFDVAVEGHCDAGGCEVSVGTGCSATPYVGAAGERWGVGAIAGLMMGLGMMVSRRRRRA